MNKVKGCFVFRNEDHGCLTSKYLEHNSITPYTETSKRQGVAASDDPFEGDFDTCWLEPGFRTGRLSIQKKMEVYDLTWTSISDSSSTYKGTAMTFEGKLVGCYWIL